MKNKITKLSPLFLLVIAGAVLTVGDLFAATWVRNNHLYFYLATFFFYLLGMILLMRSYQREDIPVASTIMVVANVIILSVIGALFLEEPLNRWQVFGIFLCFVSIFLLEYGKKTI